jgi:sulfhydrogenase subunit beta (sulfur reductase)
MSELLSATSLYQLIGRWISDGKRVAGPQCVKPDDGPHHNHVIQYTWLDAPEQLLLGGFVRPANSIKQFIFPRHEVLYGYSVKGKKIELTPAALPTREQVIVGARPCDAAALAILDDVFNWDFKDEFYNRRRELTTVVTIACREYDEFCFCTSIGSSPADARGSDVVLVPLDGERFEVRCLTEKGKRLFAGATTQSAEEAAISQGPPVKFDLDAVGRFLAGGYEQPEWKDDTRRCLGCGACAFTCPTCHCFDIVDEGTASGGVRARNWDACQFSMFTLHASGHNPRSDQGQRQRQRIHHKFQIYPEKFGEILCTGCGNCSRNCPVAMGVLPVLEEIASRQGPSAPAK